MTGRLHRIAIIGAGAVGQALASAFSRAGHTVALGIRGSVQVEAELSNLPQATPAQVAEDAELIVLAVPFTALEELSSSLPLPAGKIVVDVTNPLRADSLGLAVAGDDSGGETTARLWPQARVVKAFNTTGHENLRDPARLGTEPALPVAGDDDEARRTVIELARSCGWHALDAGPLVNARLTEAFAMLWIWLAHPGGLGRDFGFSLVHASRTEVPR